MNLFHLKKEYKVLMQKENLTAKLVDIVHHISINIYIIVFIILISKCIEYKNFNTICSII